MWPYLPKECTTPVPTNPGTACNEGTLANNFIYKGIDLSCLGVINDTNLTQVLQQIDISLCSKEFIQYLLNSIQASPQNYTEFITLINNAVNCSTVLGCTTTTTTTVTQVLIVELLGCCNGNTEYVLYNPLLTNLPAVFTATNGQPYEVVGGALTLGTPTVTITNFTNYITCGDWITIFGSCP